MMCHSFNPVHAAKYGLQEAVVINFLQYWIGHNKKKGINNIDGYTWSYNSVKALCEKFPYLTYKQIRATLDRLVILKVLFKSNYNATRYDRTCWYAFRNETEFVIDSTHTQSTDIEPLAPVGKSNIPEGHIELTLEATGFAQQGQPIPLVNSLYNNTETILAPVMIKTAEKKKTKPTMPPPEVPPLADRQRAFQQEVFDFRMSNPERYPISFFHEFYHHWAEPSPDGLSMRKEEQKYFGIEKRMESWWNNVKDADRKKMWDEHRSFMLYQVRSSKQKSPEEQLLKHITRSNQPELFK